MQNSGRVKSQGIEFETKARPLDDLILTLNGSYTDARANGPIPNLNAPDGADAPYFPRTILSVGAEYLSPMPLGKLRWSTDYTYRSSAWTLFDETSPLARQIPSSRMLNASITYVLPRWEAGVYGTNLTNDLLISSILPNTFAPYQPGDRVFVGRPRTVGMRFHVNF